MRRRNLRTGCLAAVAAILLSMAPAAADSPWRQVTSTGPSGRFGAHTAFDPNTGLVILFGGCKKLTSSTVLVTLEDGQTKTLTNHRWCHQADALNDTWTWNASTETWTQIFPSGSLPFARYSGSMAYDYDSRSAILFGGRWDTNATTGTPSYSVAGHCFGYPSDYSIAGVESVVQDPPSGPEHDYWCFKDTWRLKRDGSGTWSWIKLSPTASPSQRFEAGIAFNRTGRPTLVGGCHQMGMVGPHKEGEYDKPTYWDCTQYAGTSRVDAMKCPVPGMVVYNELCGTAHVQQTDTWVLSWSGDPDAGGTPTWTQAGCLEPSYYDRPPCAPSKARGYAVGFEPAARMVHLFGGYYYEPINSYGGYLGDTWAFDGTAWKRELRTGKHDKWCPSLSAQTAWGRSTHVRLDGKWQLLHQGGRGKYGSSTTLCPEGVTDPSVPRNLDEAVWSDSWLWDNAVCTPSDSDRNCWKKQGTGTPGARYHQSTAFDHSRGKLLLFGGLGCLTCTSGSSQTWVFPAQTASDPCGSTCG